MACFWKYPWEFASAMAFIKALNLLISGYSFETALKDIVLLNGWMGTINKGTEPRSSGRNEGH